MSRERINKLEEVEANKIIWVYRGIFPLDELPKGAKAREILFEKIGFEFDTNWSNGESPKFRSIDAPFPTDDPAGYIREKLEGLIAEERPLAVVVTSLDGGSNLADVGTELSQYFDPKKTLEVYKEITTRERIPFFYIPRSELFQD